MCLVKVYSLRNLEKVWLLPNLLWILVYHNLLNLPNVVMRSRFLNATKDKSWNYTNPGMNICFVQSLSSLSTAILWTWQKQVSLLTALKRTSGNLGEILAPGWSFSLSNLWVFSSCKLLIWTEIMMSLIGPNTQKHKSWSTTDPILSTVWNVKAIILLTLHSSVRCNLTHENKHHFGYARVFFSFPIFSLKIWSDILLGGLLVQQWQNLFELWRTQGIIWRKHCSSTWIGLGLTSWKDKG